MTMPETEGEPRQKIEASVADSDAVAAQENGAKPGLFARFLKWIAKGAAQSKANTSFCPT